MSDITLHGFCLSSASYRVRIALNLKGLAYEQQNYVLRQKAHKSEGFLAKNPQGLVPALEVDGNVITQSLAIIEYLDSVKSEPRLIPEGRDERVRVQSLALSIACDIHPLNNLRVLQYLGSEMGHSQDEVNGWYQHWVLEEFKALEARLADDPLTGEYCHGDQPGLVDVCLVPQVYNALRFKCDLTPFPTIRRINEACLAMPEFEQAVPENQLDFPK